MYPRAFVVALGVGVAALAGVRPTAALPTRMDVHVPFAFHVGQASLPAGEYFIEPYSAMNPSVLLIRSIDGRHAAFILARPGESPLPTKDELIFERSASQVTLQAVSFTGGKTVVVGQPAAATAEASAKSAGTPSNRG